MDIAAEIEKSFGDGPAHRPVAETIAAGHRRVVRRRLAAGVGAAATALVIGGAAWAVAPGDGGQDRTESPGFAADPTEDSAEPSETAQTDQAVCMSDQQRCEEPVRRGREAAYLEGDGRLAVRDGWEVTARVDDPGGRGSLAVEVAKGDRLQWHLWSRDGSMSVSTLNAPDPGFDTFVAWVEEYAPHVRETGPGGKPGDGPGDWPGVERDDLVAFGPDGTLRPLGGVTVLEQQQDPDVGESFATDADASAVAYVDDGDARWFVLAREVAGSPPQYIAVPAAEGGADLAAFLELARERYAEGGGGLL